LDGTLVDAYNAVDQSVNFVLGRLGRRPAGKKAIVRAVGWGERHLLAQFVPPGELDRAAGMYRRHHAAALKKQTRLLPGARRLLKTLRRRGLKVAIASNRAIRFTRLILKRLEVAQYVDMVRCRDQVPRPKPHPDVLRDILKSLKVPPAQALFVGDMTVDLQAGRRAGVKTLAVTTGSSSKKELAACKPWRMARGLKEVEALIERLPESVFGRDRKKFLK